jgi:hypothetical protein
MANKAEDKFRKLISQRGCEVHRAGWPDFLLTTASGKAFCVEVKADADRLSAAQIRCFTALEAAGIYVRVWWERRPDSLLEWRKFLRLTTNMRNRSGGCEVGRERLSALGPWDPNAKHSDERWGKLCESQTLRGALGRREHVKGEG